MPLELMSKVWDLDLPANAKLVLLALADEAGCGNEIMARLSNVALKTGCSERQVEDILRDVTARGGLEEDGRDGEYRRYQVHFEALPARSFEQRRRRVNGR